MSRFRTIWVLFGMFIVGGFVTPRFLVGQTIVSAIQEGDTITLRRLLEQDSTLANDTSDHGNPVLHVAIESYRVESLRLLLEYGANPNSRGSYLTTALEALTSRGNPLNRPERRDTTLIAAVRMLLKYGADPNVTSVRDPALHTVFQGVGRPYQSANDYLIIQKLLLDHGARVDVPDGLGASILQTAILSSTADTSYPDYVPDALEMLLQYGADPNARDYRSYTPLMTAVQSHEQRLVKILLQHNADINAVAGEGTALDIAITVADTAIATQLRKHGGIATGISSLISAIRMGDSKRVKTLLAEHPGLAATRYQDDIFPLHIAVLLRDTSIVQMLLDHGADVNACNGRQRTALHTAVTIANLSAVRMLLDCGANIEATDKIGRTPVFMEPYDLPLDAFLVDSAVMISYLIGKQLLFSKNFPPLPNAVTVTELLLHHGANVHAIDFHRATPLHLAAQAGDIDKMRLLLDAGSAINAGDEYGFAPLHWAMLADTIVSGSLDVVRTLLKRGADISADPRIGSSHQHLTPLQLLLLRRWTGAEAELANLLIESGAPLDTRTTTDQAADTGNSPQNTESNDGLTPLHLVANPREITPAHVAVARNMLKHGANVNAVSSKGSTPLFAIVMRRRFNDASLQMATLLIESGASVNARDDQGHTPLYYARTNRLTDIENLLKTHGGRE